MDETEMTVGQLQRALAGLNPGARLTIAGGLTLYRVKQMADGSAFLEFNEAQAVLPDELKKLNPHLLVAFSRA